MNLYLVRSKRQLKGLAGKYIGSGNNGYWKLEE